VRPGEDVEQAVSSVAAKVRQPVLADLRIAEGSVNLTDVYPRQLPDLFAGEELVLFGRYTQSSDGDADIAVSGRRAGRSERYATQARFPLHDDGNDFIPRLWASRKLGFLSQQLKLNGSNPETIQEIRDLALRYGLLSEYTSYLVQEPNVVANRAGAGANFAQPSAAPAMQVGQKAVERAVGDRLRREASSSTQLAAAEEAAAARDERKDRDNANTRLVGGRQFKLEAEVWKEQAQRSSNRVVTIEPFSEAYFAVLRQLPELETYWKQLGNVLVAGQRVSVQVAKGGVARLSAVELTRLTSEFRSR
jgi:Ca-activated chloride channel family protein